MNYDGGIFPAASGSGRRLIGRTARWVEFGS